MLVIGALLFPDLDQADFTGPFEVLSRLPDSQFLILAKDLTPVRDTKGLVLTPQISFVDTPPLDVLIVPGGPGVNSVMEDKETLAFLRHQAAGARLILSVCTGALLCGAAGLLSGRRATTHWASHHLLSLFGAVPQNARVVVDGPLVSAAGVTSGIDAALQAAAILCGDQVAQEIQLYMEYAPAPPFSSGSPETAPDTVRDAVQGSLASVTNERLAIVRRVTGQFPATRPTSP